MTREDRASRAPFLLREERGRGEGVSAAGVALALLTLASFAGCHRAEASAPEAKTVIPKIHVETVEVATASVPKLLTITGVLEADMRTDLSANAQGRVIRTFVERGDHVKAGQLLAQLDTRAAVLTQAEAVANAASISETLRNLRSDCERYKKLLDRGAITQQEYDRQTTSCATQGASEEAARARAAEAAQTLNDAAIRAPFAGVVGERFVSVGDYVKPDTRVATLLVDDPLRLQLTVPEPSIGFVKEGVAVSFETVARPGKAFEATVKFMGREVRQSTRDLVVEAVSPNPEHQLLPGMFVTAHLGVGSESLPVVPKKSVVRVETSDTVFLLNDGHIEQHVIQTGPAFGDLVAVVDGVKKGDKIVASPNAQTVDGAEVE
jgi:RND family efflux transporter MFP subunit